MKSQPKSNYFTLAVLFTFLQQALVALSTWALIRMSQGVVDNNIEALANWFLLFIGALILAYLPSLLARVYQSQAPILEILRYLGRFRANFHSRTLFFGQKQEKDQRSSYWTTESWLTFTEYQAFLLDFLSLTFSVALNVLVLSISLSLGFLPVLALALVINIVWFRILPKRVTGTFISFQKARNGLFQVLGSFWDHTVLANEYNSELYENRLTHQVEQCRTTARSSMLWQELAMVLPMFSSLLLLGGFFFWELNQRGAVLMAGFISTLPRQIQMIQYLSEITGYTIQRKSWRARKAKLNKMAEAPSEYPDPPVDWGKIQFSRDTKTIGFRDFEELSYQIRNTSQGRWRIQGPNGSGKSTLAARLKEQLGPQAYYLPVEHQLTFSSDNPSASSGERLKSQIQELAEALSCSHIILDEWDSNLDYKARGELDILLDKLAQNCCLVEITHRG